MNQLKGFSLIEVLVSLMLVTTLALALLQQQGKTQLWIKQFLLYSGASHVLDQVNESLYAKIDKIPKAPPPYNLDIQPNKNNLNLSIRWFNNSESLTRTMRRIG